MYDDIAAYKGQQYNEMNKKTSLEEFNAYVKEMNDRAQQLTYSCRDIDNKIKTTDRYIDQFLPFRMIKEVSSFIEFLMPNEQIKIRIL